MRPNVVLLVLVKITQKIGSMGGGGSDPHIPLLPMPLPGSILSLKKYMTSNVKCFYGRKFFDFVILAPPLENFLATPLSLILALYHLSLFCLETGVLLIVVEWVSAEWPNINFQCYEYKLGTKQ